MFATAIVLMLESPLVMVTDMTVHPSGPVTDVSRWPGGPVRHLEGHASGDVRDLTAAPAAPVSIPIPSPQPPYDPGVAPQIPPPGADTTSPTAIATASPARPAAPQAPQDTGGAASTTTPVGSLLAPYCTSSGTQSVVNSPTNTGAIRASDLTKTFGVEIHFRNGGPYNLANVQQALAYLNPNGIGTGVATVRDDTVSSASDLASLGAAGYKLDIYASYNPSGSNTAGSYVNDLSPLIQAGYVSVLEGGLEVDNGGWGLAVHGGSYTALNGQTYTGYQATAAMSKDLLTTFGGHVPIAAPSMANPSDGAAGAVLAQGANAMGGAAATATLGNVHYYPHNGNPPNVEMAGTIGAETGWTSGMPFIMSETGFNDCQTCGGSYAGDPLSNAAYTVNLLLDAFKAGSKLTDLYELFDQPNPAAAQAGGMESHWGLFNSDGTPKPSAMALRGLMSIIGDCGASSATFPSCGTVNYSLSGLPGSGQSLLVQKSNGTYDLIVWNDQNVMAGDTTVNNVSVHLGGNYAYNVYDPLVGTTAQQSGAGSSLTVQVSDHPVVIELGANGAAPAACGVPAATTPAQTPIPAATASPAASSSAPVTTAPAPVSAPLPASSGPSVTVSTDQALQAAVTNASPGTTIHVAPGTYSGGLNITADNVTLVSDTPGGATIIGGGVTSNGDMVTLSGNNDVLQGFNVSGAQSPGLYSMVTALGSNDTVASNNVHDLQTGGLLSWGSAIGTDSSIKGCSGGQIVGNTVSNVGPPGSTSNTVQGVYVASAGVKVSGNAISNISSTCITSWHAATAMTVTDNTCANANQGITVGASVGTNTGSIVTGNTVTGTNAPIDQEGSVGTNTITNNTIN